MISYDEFDLQDELRFGPEKKDDTGYSNGLAACCSSGADKTANAAKSAEEQHLLDGSSQELVLSVGTLPKHS